MIRNILSINTIKTIKQIRNMSSINIIFKNENKIKEVKLDKSTINNDIISLLDLAKLNNIDIEAACDSSLACSTCHVILNENIYNKLEEPIDDEMDMLEIAPDLTDTSRLSCQIKLNDILSNVRENSIDINIPSFNKNSMYY